MYKHYRILCFSKTTHAGPTSSQYAFNTCNTKHITFCFDKGTAKANYGTVSIGKYYLNIILALLDYIYLKMLRLTYNYYIAICDVNQCILCRTNR